MVIRVVRMAFFILITTVALVTFIQRVTEESSQPSFTTPPPRVVSTEPGRTGTAAPSPRPPPQADAAPPIEVNWWVPVAIALALFGIVLLIAVATPNKKISSISAIMFGLLAGILATVAISAVMELTLRVWLPDKAIEAIEPLIQIIKPLLGIALCYLGITTILQTQDDFRLVIPYIEFAKQIRGTKPLILDTSALIDARISDVAATGLLQAPLIIPRFVVAELQMLSDSNDKLKRTRGRRGLDVVTRLQRQGTLDVSIDETPVVSVAVDQALVELADRLTARLVTTDLGLTRVAQIHGVVVLNMHEVAAAFKPALIPGQTLSLRLVKAGEQSGQAVGYLDDGTMVVAEGAADMLGQEAQLVVTSTIQTSAGRMVFTRPVGEGSERDERGEIEASESTPSQGQFAAIVADADRQRDAPAETADPEAMVSETVPHPNRASGPAGLGNSGAGAGHGPFPPKPPARRPPSPRNPRR